MGGTHQSKSSKRQLTDYNYNQTRKRGRIWQPNAAAIIYIFRVTFKDASLICFLAWPRHRLLFQQQIKNRLECDAAHLKLSATLLLTILTVLTVQSLRI